MFEIRTQKSLNFKTLTVPEKDYDLAHLLLFWRQRILLAWAEFSDRVQQTGKSYLRLKRPAVAALLRAAVAAQASAQWSRVSIVDNSLDRFRVDNSLDRFRCFLFGNGAVHPTDLGCEGACPWAAPEPRASNCCNDLK